jgi:transmembrane 9 superfamily protein 3
VDHHYWYELFMDDLPVWGFVGELKSSAGAEPDALVYSHKQLDISYNGDRVSRNCIKTQQVH